MILWYSKWYYDIQRERILKGMFQSIHYQLCQMCPVSIVSVMCHQHLWNSLLQGLTADVKRLIEFDISRWRISKSQIPPLLYIVPPDQSLPPQQPNPNSNSHPGSDPARGLQEAPSHPTDPTSEGNPGWDFHPPLDNLTQGGNWSDGISLVRWNWEPNRRWLMNAPPPLGGRRLVAAGASDADFNEAL